MSDPHFVDIELSGWKQIADVAGCSEDSAQRAAMRNHDPLPVYYDPWGNPVTWRSAVKAWKHRNTLPAKVYQTLKAAKMLPAQRECGAERSTAGHIAKASGTIVKKRAVMR